MLTSFSLLSGLSDFLFFFFWLCYAAAGILVPQSGINLCPLHWEPGVLTTGWPGESWLSHFLTELSSLTAWIIQWVSGPTLYSTFHSNNFIMSLVQPLSISRPFFSLSSLCLQSLQGLIWPAHTTVYLSLNTIMSLLTSHGLKHNPFQLYPDQPGKA